MKKRAVFFDKDGTLVEDLPYNIEPRRITLCGGAGTAVRLLAQLDYRLFIVTNQDGIARGHFPEAAMEAVRDRVADLLFREQVQLEGFYFCPHHPEGSVAAFARPCGCRKPQPGMLLQAAREHDIDLASSWMVGDILHDVEAGSRAGCRTLLVDRGNETEWRLGPYRVPTRIVTDLVSAARIIAAADGVRA